MAGVKVAAAVSFAALIPVLGELPDYTTLAGLSGLAGGFCRWVALREQWWPQGIGSVALGGVTAIFLWPVAGGLFEPLIGRVDMEPAAARMLGGFLTGLSGVSLVGLYLDFIRARSRVVNKEGRDDA